MDRKARPTPPPASSDNNIRALSILVVDFDRTLHGVGVALKYPNDKIQPLLSEVSRQAHQFVSPIPVLEIRSTPDVKGLTVLQWSQVVQITASQVDKAGLQLLCVALGVAILRETARQELEPSSKDLDLIWNYIYQGLTGGQMHFTVSRSAQGFLAVPLCSILKNDQIEELFRFHVWVPDGERGRPEVAIHSHQPFAQSWILLGGGTDHTFSVKAATAQCSATHAEYMPKWDDGKQSGTSYKTHQLSSTVSNTGKLLTVEEVAVRRHTRDMTYTIAEGVHHSSVVGPQSLHATLFMFDSHRGFLQAAGIAGDIEGKSYTQSRDPQGMTSSCLAHMAHAMRRWEKSQGADLEELNEHPLSIAYWKYFYGSALLEAGQRAQALDLFNSTADGHPLLLTFCKWPIPEHRDYVKYLLNAGADPNLTNVSGYKALDYALRNDDTETEAMLLTALGGAR